MHIYFEHLSVLGKNRRVVSHWPEIWCIVWVGPGIESANSLLNCKVRGNCGKSEKVYKGLSKECVERLEEERDRQKTLWAKKLAKLQQKLDNATGIH